VIIYKVSIVVRRVNKKIESPPLIKNTPSKLNLVTLVDSLV